MRTSRALAALAFAGIGGVASADTVVIDFESLTPPVSVTEQYAGQGVHFSSTGAFDSNGNFHNSVEVFDFPFPGYGTKAAGMWGNIVTISFDMDVSEFSVLLADTEVGTFLGSVRALDSDGNQIGTDSSNTGGYNTPSFFQKTLSVNVGGIRSVQLVTDADGAVIDNVTFTMVPAPATACLGLLGLGAARRRR